MGSRAHLGGEHESAGGADGLREADSGVGEHDAACVRESEAHDAERDVREPLGRDSVPQTDPHERQQRSVEKRLSEP